MTASGSRNRASSSNENDSSAAAMCCVFRILGVVLVSFFEVVLINNGWTFTPWFFLLFLLLLVRSPRRREHELVPGEEETDLSTTAEESRARREEFQLLVNDIKSQMRCHFEESDEDLITDALHQVVRKPTSGVYRVCCRSGLSEDRYRLDLSFDENDHRTWKIRGKAFGDRSDNDAIRVLFGIREGFVAKKSGKAYWIGDQVRTSQSHVAQGMFVGLDATNNDDAGRNAFQGDFISSLGRRGVLRSRRGTYLRFELLQATNNDETIDAPAEVVVVEEKVAVAAVAHASATGGLPEVKVVAVDAPAKVRVMVDDEEAAAASITQASAMGGHPNSKRVAVNHDASVVQPTTDISDSRNSQNGPRRQDNVSFLSSPSQGQAIPEQFQSVVDKASTETTEVEASYKSKKTVIDSDHLDGTYDLEYEDHVGRLITATMHLSFTRAFCGWKIQGTRNGPDDGPFSMQKGFLAKSCKVYWQERSEFEPRHSVLIQGRVTPNGDENTGPTFRGEWLSSTDLQHGIVTKWCRQDNEDQAENKVVALSSDIV